MIMSAERANDCYVALELSQRTWLIGYLLPGSDKAQTTAVAGGNAEALLSARGGSVCLNSFGRFVKWISASIMPPPSLVSAR
jgi:hypothetical protein